MRKIIKIDGTEIPVERKTPVRNIAKLIGADMLDTVTLKHLGHPMHVMFVDDLGHCPDPNDLKDAVRKINSVNRKATELYHANCIPGTTWEIIGDVFICPDSDFE